MKNQCVINSSHIVHITVKISLHGYKYSPKNIQPQALGKPLPPHLFV